jgi:hypothetical protein
VFLLSSVNQEVAPGYVHSFRLFDLDGFGQLSNEIHAHVFKYSILEKALQIHRHVNLKPTDKVHSIEVRRIGQQ